MRTPALQSVLISVVTLVGFLTVQSCGSRSDQHKGEAAIQDTLYPESTLSEGIKKEIYSLPTPFQVAQMLEQAKAGYIFDITYPPDSAGRYLIEKSRALMLGVYSADLAYSATYNHHDQAAKFLNANRMLSDELGISGVYEEHLIEKVKQVGNNKDSLVVLVNQVFVHTSAFLSSQNRHYLAVLIATGAYVESIYLAAELSVVAKDNTLIVNGILDQQDNLNRLLTVLEAFQKCKVMSEITGNVARLRAMYTDYGLKRGSRLDHEKAIELSKLVEQVRKSLCTSTNDPVK